MKTLAGMNDRRNALKLMGTGVCGAIFLSFMPNAARAAGWSELDDKSVPPEEDIDSTLKRLFGNRQVEYVGDDKLKFVAPNVAENGAVVPLEVELLQPIEDGNYVKTIYFVADKNKRPHALTFAFTPETGVGYAAAYLRMGGTSWVRAILEMNNGKLIGTKTEIKVVASGCGG